MTDQEFQREVLRGIKTLIHACIARYGLGWSDFLPREENAIIRALAADNDRLTFDCSEHGPAVILSVYDGELKLACGCAYAFRETVWERLVVTPTVTLAYRVKA